MLLAGTVLKLGTKQHHDRLLSVIDSLDATGCFALTELGFGEQPASVMHAFSQAHHLTCSGRMHPGFQAFLRWTSC